MIASCVDRLTELGYLDDGEYARRRAVVLAERGYGDYAILASLEHEGFPEQDARRAVRELPPELNERSRAARLLEKRSGTDRTRLIRFLMGRGFPLDLVIDMTNGVDR